MVTVKSIQNVRQRMEILNKLVDEYKDSQPLEGVSVLFLQHQLTNQYAQASALIELGLDPKKLYWIDIPYTSNSIVRKALYNLGIPKKNFYIHSCRLITKYGNYQRKRVQSWIKEFLPKFKGNDRLLVLDDGAYFLEAIVCFKNKFENIAIVEQTARGIIKIDKNAAMRAYLDQIPLINVAKSKPKIELEPKYIGNEVTDSLIEKLNKHRDQIVFGDKTNCLILGYGNIGCAVADSISNSFEINRKNIFIHDPNQVLEEKAIQDGYSIWNRDDLSKRFNLVIGCSGQSSFNIGDHIYLENGAYLASASSGASELSREAFIELADNVSYDDIEVLNRNAIAKQSLHNQIQIQFPHSDATFLNGGFPINFDGERVEGIRAEYIQATIAMMVYGAILAVTTKEKGIIPLDSHFNEWLIKEFRNLEKQLDKKNEHDV